MIQNRELPWLLLSKLIAHHLVLLLLHLLVEVHELDTTTGVNLHLCDIPTLEILATHHHATSVGVLAFVIILRILLVLLLLLLFF